VVWCCHAKGGLWLRTTGIGSCHFART
jgi:hypothetical protein